LGIAGNGPGTPCSSHAIGTQCSYTVSK